MLLATTEGDRKNDSLISAEENRAMFDYIARYYDGTNRILSLSLDLRWRRQAVDALAPIAGRTYLDVGCGTGDMAVEILRRSPRSKVVGIDPSEGMLEVGREKVKAAGLGESISLLRGNVLDLDYEDNSFDGAITAFCIRNVTDRRRGLEEIRRVLRPGSRLVILELTEPQGPIMRPLFRTYAFVVMPLVTLAMSSASAYRYLANSMADFPKPGTFLSILGEAGFVNTKHAHMTGGIVTVFEGLVPAKV